MPALYGPEAGGVAVLPSPHNLNHTAGAFSFETWPIDPDAQFGDPTKWTGS